VKVIVHPSHSNLAGWSKMAGFVRRAGRPPWDFAGEGARATQTLGGSGPTREKDAGRSAGAFDALLRRALLCGEVPE
jgi:hypothetical protein